MRLSAKPRLFFLPDRDKPGRWHFARGKKRAARCAALFNRSVSCSVLELELLDVVVDGIADINGLAVGRHGHGVGLPELVGAEAFLAGIAQDLSVLAQMHEHA